MKMLTYIYDLLRSKCESEQNLLTLMVNKMGDLEKKVASKASYLLSQLLIEHPAMKGVVIKEVERFLFRSNILERAQYYSINFLNQMVLTNRPEDVAVANYLVQLYFTLFEGLVVTAKESRATADNKKKPKNKKLKKKQAKKVLVQSSVDGMNAKMMAGLLTGVNRAFPYSKMEDEVFEEHMNTLFEICHIGTFHTCIQSLALIFQVQSNRQSLSDRFYRTLYEVLLDSRLASSSKQAVFMNLLFKSLKSDVSMPRTAAFVKRLIQVCAQSQVPFTCASLYLIGEVVKAKPGLKVLLNSPENDDGEEHFVDVDDGEDADDAQESNSVSILGKDVEENPTITEYDGKKREPLFAKADHVCLWDLVPFSRHFHPTVSLYAQKLIVGAEIPTPKDGSNYDPLRNHTLTLFLDRFVYKNPKKEVAKHSGSSLMQPHQNKKAFQQEQPMNLVDWTHKTETEIAADELFFVQYFKEKSKQEGKGKKKSKGDDDDDEDALLGGLGSGSEAGEDMDDEFTWDAMQNSSGFPSELKEDGDDDEPLTFEDLDGSEAEEDLDINQDDEDVDQEALAAQFAEMDGLDASLDDDALETPSDDGEGDADMAAFLQDEVSSDEEEENSKPSKGKSPLGKKKRGKLAKLAEQAKAKGYRGCFFEAAGGKSDFADADEFMDLMDRDMASAQESDVEEAEVTPGKKRDAPRGFPSKGKKKARRS